jgi:hypothetical protein
LGASIWNPLGRTWRRNRRMNSSAERVILLIVVAIVLPLGRFAANIVCQELGRSFFAGVVSILRRHAACSLYSRNMFAR